MNKKYNKPDIKGPRFRQPGYNVINSDFFKQLKLKYPKYKDVSDSDIRNIIKKFNELLWDTVVEYRDGVEFPESLGRLFIGTCENAKSQNIDFSKSHKYGVTVNNKNWDTDGKLAKIFYTSFANKYKFQFRECWGFVACRNFKRKVAKTYPENWTMYVAIDSTKKLRKIYNASYLKEVRDRNVKEELTKYNEFDL